MDNYENRLATEQEIVLYTIPCWEVSSRWLDWQEFDRGPGIFRIPEGYYLGVRAQGLRRSGNSLRNFSRRNASAI